MNRYKVESMSKDRKSKFSAICGEDKLEYYMQVCKFGRIDNICFYRKYPLTKAKKIYF